MWSLRHPVKRVLLLSPFYRWNTEAGKWKHHVLLTRAARFCGVPFSTTLWDLQMGQALCKALRLEAETLPSKSPYSMRSGEPRKSRVVLTPSHRTRCCKGNVCNGIPWHGEASLGQLCSSGQCDLSGFSKYRRSHLLSVVSRSTLSPHLLTDHRFASFHVFVFSGTYFSSQFCLLLLFLC